MNSGNSESIFLHHRINEQFYVEERLDSGGMADVYKAIDLRTDKWVALKVYANEKGFSSFRKEIRLLRSLNHPNIQRILLNGVHQGFPYYVMPLYENLNFRQFLDSKDTLPERDILFFFTQITDAVSYLHAHRIIHNDLKPQNILVAKNELLLLGDFGLAQRCTKSISRKSKKNTIWGSPVYLAPELASGKTQSFSSDVYSLGIILFILYLGYPPFFHDDLESLISMHQAMPVPLPRRTNPSITQEVQSIILKSLAKRPQERYRNAQQLHTSVLQYWKTNEEAIDQVSIPRYPHTPSHQHKTRRIIKEAAKDASCSKIK